MRAAACALLVAGCAATEPAGLGAVEESDFRLFAPPPGPDRDQRVADLVRKDELTLDDAVRLADIANPRLAADRLNIDLATAALWQAKLYPNPSFVYDLEEWAPSGGDTQMSAGISTPLVISDRIDAATRLAETERSISAIEFLARRREMLSDVKRAFVRMLAASTRLALAEETRTLAQALLEAAKERLAAQAVPEMEVLKASVSLARADADLRTARKDADVSRRALLGLLGGAARADVRFAGELGTAFPAADLEELRRRTEESHPLLRAAEERKEAARRALDLEREKKWQDWEVELKGGRSTEAEFILEAGVRIPLPLTDRNQAGLRAAEVRSAQAALEFEAARNALLPHVGEAYDAFMAARDRVGIFRSTILPEAGRALDQTREGYRLGKFGYLDVLDAQRTLAEARITYTDALAELNETAVTLEELSGEPLLPEAKEEVR